MKIKIEYFRAESILLCITVHHKMLWLLLIVLIIIVAILIYRAMSRPHSAEIWSANIEKETLANTNWRKVVATSDNLQVVEMSTPPGEALGWEVHPTNDQFFRIESGECEVSTKYGDNSNVKTVKLTDGMATLIPQGIYHNVVNTGKEPLRMYTIYGPPHHPPGTVDRTHADEIARETE